MTDVLRLLRYNTGNDKKVFIEFKDSFDAVIFNATIVAYSGASVADLVSVHKNQYIIDPQTHILQHDTSAIKKKETQGVKKSVQKYLKELPQQIADILIKQNRAATYDELLNLHEELALSVWNFQTKYIKGFIQDKEYNKYLDFAGVQPEPRLVIAPYFMLKSKYSTSQAKDWMLLNKMSLNAFQSCAVASGEQYPIAAQLVLDQKSLLCPNLENLIRDTYNQSFYEYVFIWIENFNSFVAPLAQRKAFRTLLKTFALLGKKPIMAYGGYDAILLCHPEITNRLYGVAQSVGYGEVREVTPVGGGLPVNKYYFLPRHERLNVGEAAQLLIEDGYFSLDKPHSQQAKDYYANICNCPTCNDVIGNDIDGFYQYNESVAVIFKNNIKRNKPTTDAALIAAKHFVHCKKTEWDKIQLETLKVLTAELLQGAQKYGSVAHLRSIKEWCGLYAE